MAIVVIKIGPQSPIVARIKVAGTPNRLLLDRAGTRIGALDLLIAAQAAALGLTVVTNNLREFRRVPGLRVENWLA